MSNYNQVQVKIFEANQAKKLELQINEFLKGLKFKSNIKELQYSSAYIEGAGMVYSAIIMYGEIDVSND